ncbi:flagellar type III secretion system pore protein FliP [Tabrizicola caldifontis]|uniref:flagellar type III secretion system pore protein FliP n=1 Tax=Tabrizicola caldifontis TaxID=2528036 RepID=UPI001436A5BE|nr:flagellar type III secretion system pore protein FliP [Rhodobacter sp. YIM 73028]
MTRGLPLALILVLTAGPALAQRLAIDLGGDGDTLSMRSVQLLLLITVLSIAPGLAVMVTCFPFIVTVLSILRQALGLQQAPPNMLIVSLAMFLTWYVMDPVFTRAWVTGIEPMTRGQMALGPALEAAILPFREFMAQRVDPETLLTLADLRFLNAPPAPADAPLSLLVPSFMLSEIQRAFEIGFMIFLPFLIIDLVVAAVLMSMGMMMVPPAVVALPFKLAFFVVADGWALVTGALVRSYS